MLRSPSMLASGALPRRPKADTLSIEDLVAAVVDDKRIRVPRFQRRLRWGAEDVRNLLDSIYRGYPVGNLLLWEKDAPAAEVVLGPLRIEAPKRSSAWFVVDGQQRITALVAALHRTDTHGEDPFFIYFDLDAQKFLIPPRGKKPLPTWLPASRLLDAVVLNAWLIERFPNDPQVQKVALEVGRRVREYRIPIYVVETDDEAVLREIFRRANRHGAAMTQAEVFDALVGSASSSPHRLDELADDLTRVGMGRIDEHTLLQVVHAIRGKDPTKLANPKDLDGYEGLDGAVAEAAEAMMRVLTFLRDDAEIPHLRFLPYKQPLVILPRFFHLFPEPVARSRILLSRWVWRGFMTGAHADSRKPAREGIRCIKPSDEELSVQQLLSQVPQDQGHVSWSLGEQLDARSAVDRIALLGLASLRPRSLDDFLELDVASLLEEHGSEAIVPITSPSSPKPSVAGHILHPPRRRPAQELLVLATNGAWPGLLESHALDKESLPLLITGRMTEFIDLRAAKISVLVEGLARRMCGWGYGDRPSIEYLLHREERS